MKEVVITTKEEIENLKRNVHINTIDECINILKSKAWTDDGYLLFDNVMVSVKQIIGELGELKEQKND